MPHPVLTNFSVVSRSPLSSRRSQFEILAIQSCLTGSPDAAAPPPHTHRHAWPHTTPEIHGRSRKGGPQRSGGPPFRSKPRRGAGATPAGCCVPLLRSRRNAERNTRTKQADPPRPTRSNGRTVPRPRLRRGADPRFTREREPRRDVSLDVALRETPGLQQGHRRSLHQASPGRRFRASGEKKRRALFVAVVARRQ